MESDPRKSNGSGDQDAILVSPLADAVDDDYRLLWRERGLPELLWIAELLRGRRLRESFRLAIAVASAGRRARGAGSFDLFAAAGSFGALDASSFDALRAELAERDALEPLATALRDLNALYADSPFARLRDDAAPSPADAAASTTAALAQSFRDRVEALVEPTTRIALRVQLVVLWQAVQAGIVRGTAPEQVAAMAHATRFPLTAESVDAARAALGLASQLLRVAAILPETAWPERFWSCLARLGE